MAPPANPPSETSEIPPLRSAVLFMLVITSILITAITNHTPDDVSDLPLIILRIAFQMAYWSSIIGFSLMVLTDRTKYCKALASHFWISSTLSLLLCFSKWIEKGGTNNFSNEDFAFCATAATWMLTWGMLSAIWIRGGVAALIHEVKAVPGNLWLCLYE